MAAMQCVLDPTAPPGIRLLVKGHMLRSLEGAVVGFIDNAKPNFEYLVEDLGKILLERCGVARVVGRRKRGAAMPAPAEYIDALASECDLVITGSGD